MTADVLGALAPTATRHCVGKQGATPAPPQHQINALLVELGKTGACVVRLKAGDPFVVSRGGEEAMALAEAGVGVDDEVDWAAVARLDVSGASRAHP